jgi:hypothetical protein
MLLLLKKTQASKASDTLTLISPLGFSEPDLLPLIYALTLTRLGPSHRHTVIYHNLPIAIAMPPKNKKTKAEEALDFLSNLDNLDEAPPAAASPKETTKPTSSTPRPSTDSSRPKTDTTGTSESRKSIEQTNKQNTDPAEDEEAAKALAFLEAQINTKRQPLSVPQSRPATPKVSAAVKEQEKKVEIEEPAASTSTTQGGGGWGSSWWSSASSALQSAQKIADEQYQKVKTEGVGGVTGQLEHLNVKGVDLAKLRKEAEERLGGIVKNVDLEKLRESIVPSRWA